MPMLDLRGGSARVDHLDFGRGNFIRLTSNVLLEIVSGDAVITLPTSSLTLATLTGTETLTNKTIDLASNTLAATSAQMLTAVTDETGTGLLVFATSPTLTTPVIGAATGTSLSLTGALACGTTMTPGTGIFPTGAESYEAGVWTLGGVIVTQIIVDLTGLDSSTTDGDILGDGTEANSHWGQVTTAVNGALIAGSITCLEAPAGGQADIDFWSATEATGAGDSAITDLTETALLGSGAAWTNGRQLGLTTVVPANGYIYMTSGAAGTAAAYTAGKFLIELYGT